MKPHVWKAWQHNSRRTIAVTAISLVIAACSKPQSPPPATEATPPVPPPATAATPAMPDASAATQPQGPAAGVTPADTAKASDPAMKSMSKKEESTSMPMPAQANDHSTVVDDGKK
jgi:hypothetical protein